MNHSSQRSSCLNSATPSEKKLIQTPQTSRVDACGKVILVGEHGVVYGAKAVAMPIQNMGIEASFYPMTNRQHQGGIEKAYPYNSTIAEMTPTLADPQNIAFHDEDKQFAETWIFNGKPVGPILRELIANAFKLLGIQPFPIHIETRSSLRIGAGLGSSACLSVVILKALTQSLGQALDTSRLANLANRLERQFHGRPSGLDTAVVAYGQTIEFSKTSTPRTIEGKQFKQWPFVLIDSGVRSSTKDMIKKATPYFLGQAGEKRVERFNKVSQMMIDALEKGAIHAAKEAIYESQKLLHEIHVIGDHLNSMLSSLNSIGIHACKPTGAGGGGFILALLDPKRAIDDFQKIAKLFDSKNVMKVSPI